MLLRLLETGDAHLRAELLRRHRTETNKPAGTNRAGGGPRSIDQLLNLAREQAEARRRAEVKKAAEEQARRQREQAIARAEYLDQLSGHEAETWGQLDALIAAKRPVDYDRTVQLLVDLRDLYARNHRPDEVTDRLSRLRDQHTLKPKPLKRLENVGLATA